MKEKKRRVPVLKDSWSKFIMYGNRLFFQVMFYSMVMFLGLKPVFNTGIKFAMDVVGYSYITTENVISFFIQPATIIVLICLIFIFAFVIFYGLTYVIIYISYIEHNKKCSIITCHIETAKRCFFSIRAHYIGTIFLSILFVINSNLALIYGIITRSRIPRYILNNIIKMPKIMYLLGIITILFFGIWYCCIFTIPYCILEGKTFLDGIRSSKSLLKGRHLKTVGYFIFWNSMLAIVSVGLYLLTLVFAAVGVALFVKETLAVAMFLSIYNQINFYVGFVVGVLGIIVNITLVIYLYFNYKKEQQEKLQYIKSSYLSYGKNWFSKKTIMIITFILIGSDLIYTYDVVRNGTPVAEENFSYIGITSHRGNSYYAPENTVPSIQSAIESLANFAEIDVQQTKDGVVVLLHDSSLKRTTGVDEKIWNMNYDEVIKLDAGSWYGSEFRGTYIPTLEEILILCKGRINLNIELKNASKVPGLEEKVVELIQRYDFERQCVITSTNIKSLMKVKELNVRLKTGYIIAVAYGNFYDREEIDFFSLKSSFLNEEIVQKIHNKGKEIHAWTVNSKRELERMKRLEIDNIITDKPVYAREIIYQEESNKNIIELLNVVLKWKE